MKQILPPQNQIKQQGAREFLLFPVGLPADSCSQGHCAPRAAKRPRRKGLAILLMLCVLGAGATGNCAAQSGKDKWRAEWQRQWLAAHTHTSSASKNAANSNAAQNHAGAAAASPASPAGTAPVGNAISVLPTAAKPSQPAPTPAPVPSVSPKPAAPPAVPISAPAAGNVAAPPASVKPPVHSTSAAPPAPLNLAEKTRPDLFATTDATSAPSSSASGNAKSGAHTQDNPFAAVGDAWKMLAYLLPMLLVILGSLHLLKRFQMRTGRLPGMLSSANFANGRAASIPRPRGNVLNTLLSGFHLPTARPKNRNSIRLLESAPLGGAQVHLLEVRGRVLLLGTTPTSLNLLTEFEPRDDDGDADFRNMLHSAAADMDALDYEQPDLPAAATVSTLEELLRETGQAVSRRSRRLRTVGEVEGEDV